MEIALVVIQLLTALTGLATAAVKLCTQSTEQRLQLLIHLGTSLLLNARVKCMLTGKVPSSPCTDYMS